MTTTDPTITIAGLEARIDSLRFAVQHSNRTAAERMTMFVEASSNADRLTAERDALAAQLAEVRAELVQLGGADLARDAAEDRAARLDAELAKVRAELAAAPKVCAIHSYALEGPCMTCGAPWPGAEKALRQERVEGMEKMRRISAAVGCPNSVEEVVEAVAAIKSDLASERARLAAYKERIAGLEQAANERSRTGQVSEPERSEWIGAAVAVADALGGSLGPVSGTSGTIDPREWIHFAAGLADRAKKLTARMAELEARPVLTVEAFTEAYIKTKHGGKAWPGEEAGRRGLTAQFRATFAALGPVMLPAQDRAEELVSAWRGICTDSATCDLDPAERMRRALASLGAPPTSPPAARPVFAGVSVEELALEYARESNSIHGLRAVLARLEVSLVAPVDPEKFARNAYNSRRGPLAWDGVLTAEGRKALADEARHALTASGIPVTPERK